jgi:hypothetical protein
MTMIHWCFAAYDLLSSTDQDRTYRERAVSMGNGGIYGLGGKVCVPGPVLFLMGDSTDRTKKEIMQKFPRR